MENEKKADKQASFGPLRHSFSEASKFSVKEIVFFLASGGLFAAQAYFWSELITGEISTQPVDYVLPIISTIGFAVILALTAILATARLLGWIIFPSASIAAVLFNSLWVGSYIAAALISLALIYALYSTRAAYSNSIKLDTSHTIKAGLSGIFTAIAFLMSFYYLNVQLTKPISIIPTGLIESVVSFTSGILGQQIQEQLPAPQPDQPAAGDMGGFFPEGLPPELQNLIPSNLFDIFTQQSAQETAPASESVSQTMTKQISSTIQAQIDRLIEPYKPFIPYVFTIFFFLTVRGLMFILTWFITPLAAILLKFLIALGIVRKEIVQIEAERVFF